MPRVERPALLAVRRPPERAEHAWIISVGADVARALADHAGSAAIASARSAGELPHLALPNDAQAIAVAVGLDVAAIAAASRLAESARAKGRAVAVITATALRRFAVLRPILSGYLLHV